MAQNFSVRELRLIDSALTKDWCNLKYCIENKEWINDEDKVRMYADFKELSELMNKIVTEISKRDKEIV